MYGGPVMGDVCSIDQTGEVGGWINGTVKPGATNTTEAINPGF